MNKYRLGAILLAMFGVIAIAVPVLADTNYNNTSSKPNTSTTMNRPFGNGNEQGRGMMRPGVFGTVSIINGNTLTVLGHSGFGKGTATTTYTVDATNAKVTKSNATSSVSAIVVGDTVMVQGTVTGTNVVATAIRDGVGIGNPGMGFGRGGGKNATSTTPAFTGNGQPIVAGTISAISGETISITNKSNVAYTVDATNAKILQGNTASDISTLKTGDTVLVQGTVNGTSITATTIIDQTKPANSGNGNNNPHPGFFGGIGQFFMHLFGF